MTSVLAIVLAVVVMVGDKPGKASGELTVYPFDVL
jgi:hypothetical protein